jgi:hypothetical protein
VVCWYYSVTDLGSLQIDVEVVLDLVHVHQECILIVEHVGRLL